MKTGLQGLFVSLQYLFSVKTWIPAFVEPMGRIVSFVIYTVYECRYSPYLNRSSCNSIVWKLSKKTSHGKQRARLHDRKLGPDTWEKRHGPHDFSPFTRIIIYQRSDKKWGKDQVYKVAFTPDILGSGPLFNVRLRYCACHQRNYYASWSKNQETGMDTCFFLLVFGAIAAYGPKIEKNTGPYPRQKTWTAKFTRAKMWGPYSLLVGSVPNFSVV